MSPVELSILNEQCVHAIKLAVEGLLGAGLLTFLRMMAPYIRSGGPRR